MERPGLLGNRYEVRDVLGFGGMAEVRDGWDTRLNRAVAIKLLHPGLSSQAEIRERFTIEARAAAALNDPHIVGVYDFGDEKGTPFIVMERLPGDTLADQIALGPLSQAQVRGTLRSVLAALAAAHGAGMLHRDIKPGNILLTPSGSVKVADFGIVKAPGSAHTTTGQLVGTLAYLSADRIAGNPATVNDDLYAAGVVGYEALTGCKPFVHEDIAPLARAITEDHPTPISHLLPDVDPALAEVVERAMSRSPLRRFCSAEAMLATLNDERGRHALASPTPVRSPQRPPTRVLSPPPGVSANTFTYGTSTQTSPKRARKVAGSAALLAAMAVAAVAFALDPSSAAPPVDPEPVSVSAQVLTPTSPEPIPSPVQQPAPAPAPVVEQATQQKPHGNGNGNGNGKKGGGNNGNGRPK